MKRNYLTTLMKTLAILLLFLQISLTSKAAKVNFASTDVFATVYATMADGDTLVLTTPGTTALYTTLNGALSKSITIMADPSLTSRPVLSTNSVGAVFTPAAAGTFSKIEFIGIESYAVAPTDTVLDSRYFLDARLTTGLITTLKFKKCYMHGYSRCVIRADGSTPVFTNLIVDSCLFNDNSIGAASYPIFGLKNATITNISITNTTFYNSPGNVITYSKNNALTFVMQNCNIIDCGSFKTRIISGAVYADSNSGRLIDFTVAQNATSTFTINNCIISGKYTNKDNRPLANKINTGAFAGVNIIRFNTVTATNVNFISSILLDNVFNTPATPGGTNTPITTLVLTNNFSTKTITITTAASLISIGDPSWTIVTVPPSTDAALSDLKIDGTTVSGFLAGTLVYNVTLPYGTTAVPAITGTVNEVNATTVITQAPSVSGAGTIVVTAQDGTTKLTYTINYSVAAPSTDATLSDLKIDGTTITGFASNTYIYNIVLAPGTTAIPVITATVNEVHANTVIQQAISLPGYASIEVTAQDGTTIFAYVINFTFASTDATLTALSVAGSTLSPAFNADTLTYNILLPAGTTVGTLPVVTYTAAANATVVKTDAAVLPGSTTIEVTAQDGLTKKTYTINFRLKKNIAYITRDKTNTSELAVASQMVATAYVDPLYKLLSEDANFNVTLYKLKAADFTTPINFSAFDAVIVQESFGGGDVVFRPTGILALKSITKPFLYNKTYALKAGRALSTGGIGTGVDATTNEFRITVAPADQSNALFNGITFTGNEFPIFKAGATDLGAAGAKGINYAGSITLTPANIPLAVPFGITSTTAPLCVNDIPSGTILGGKDTIVSRMISVGFNYGAMCKNDGTNMTSAGLTLLRNAIYSLAGLTVPTAAVVEYPSNDPTLKALVVAGNSLSPVFLAATGTYSVVLPFGTTIGTLPAVTYTPAVDATAVKTDAIALPGATTIEVTAQDGVTKKTYTINFTVATPSTDATLTALAVTGNTLSPVFIAGTLTYNVLLPAGTTIGTLPLVTYTTAANATVVKTDASALPGSTTVEVTAQDGVTKLTYTINFTVTNTDATLTTLSVAGNTLSPVFDAATISYNVVLPNGTTISTLPAVNYTTATYATAIKTDASVLPGSTTIVVTAQDGTTKITYTVNFSVAPSTDAKLSDLMVNGTTVTGFSSAVTTYNVALPAGTTVIPTIAATVNQANANRIITQALSVTGTATVVVTAQDGTTKITYAINFSVLTSIGNINREPLKIMVKSNSVSFETQNVIKSIIVTDMNGKLLKKKSINSSVGSIDNLTSGIYVFTLITKNGVITKKISVVK